MAEPTGIDTNPITQAWHSICQAGVMKLLIGAAIVLNIFQVFQFFSQRQNQQDFAHYYVSSTLWLEGKQVYDVDLVPLYEELGWTDFEEFIDKEANPPGLLALFSPFTLLDPPVAHAAWMLMQMLAAVVACCLIWQCVKSEISFDGYSLILVIFLLSLIHI